MVMLAFIAFLFLLGLGFDAFYLSQVGGFVPIGSILALGVGSVSALAGYANGDKAVLLSTGGAAIKLCSLNGWQVASFRSAVAALDAAFYAAQHVLVKGALFLAVGVVAASSARRLWLGLLPAAVLALSLGGLPLTGGALAKLAVKAPLGNGVVGTLATVSAAGTTLLMLHFLQRLARSNSQDCCSSPACPALAGNGAGFRPGPLAAVPHSGRPCRRCASNAVERPRTRVPAYRPASKRRRIRRNTPACVPALAARYRFH